MTRLATRLLSSALRARVVTARRSTAPPPNPHNLNVKLKIVSLESREAPGNLAGGVVGAAFGGRMSEPIDCLALFVGDLAMFGSERPGGGLNATSAVDTHSTSSAQPSFAANSAALLPPTQQRLAEAPPPANSFVVVTSGGPDAALWASLNQPLAAFGLTNEADVPARPFVPGIETLAGGGGGGGGGASAAGGGGPTGISGSSGASAAASPGSGPVLPGFALPSVGQNGAARPSGTSAPNDTIDDPNAPPDTSFDPTQPTVLGGRVCQEWNANGILTPDEMGVPGVAVTLLDVNLAVVAATTTAPDGSYQFSGIVPGTYSVQFSAPTGFRFTGQDQGDDAIDSDADPATGLTSPVTVQAGETNLTVWAGLVPLGSPPDSPPGTATVGSRVWNDLNGDGIQGPNEPGVGGVGVTLLDADGNVAALTTTASDGTYRFTAVNPGTYTLRFDPPGGMVFTAMNQGADASADSDADPNTGQTASFVLGADSMALSMDAGLMVAAPAEGDQPTIQFRFGPSGQITQQLKVAKLSEAFSYSKATRQTSVRGVDANNHDLIDRDPDRFNVWVIDTAHADAKYIDVSISTTNSKGFEAYNDNATLIRLTPAPFGGPGVFWSKSMVMVSNRADDQYSDNRIGKDDVDVQGDDPNAVSDRTHRIALGGTVKVAYAGQSATATAPVSKVVTVNAHFLGKLDANNNLVPLMGEPFLASNQKTGIYTPGDKYADVDGSGSYTDPLDANNAIKRFQQDLVVANECFAQVGVRIVAGQAGVVNTPAAIASGVLTFNAKSVTGDANLTADEKTLVQGGFNSAATDDVEAYYAVRLSDADGLLAGRAFTPDFYVNMTTPDIYDSFVVSDNSRYYSFAHELSRVLGQAYLTKVDQPNLKAPTTYIIQESQAKFTDARRLNTGQESKMLASEYMHPPS